jgi:hypothetical protein
MALSKKAIEEFKAIYKKEFKKDISDDKAQELGQNLIDLFRIIYRPIPEDFRQRCSCNKMLQTNQPGLDMPRKRRDDGPNHPKFQNL